MDSIKCSCVDFYENDFTQYLLGDIFHPGGLDLTDRIAREIGLGEGDLVLDVACGQGTSIYYLVETYKCGAIGVDLSRENLAVAEEKARERGIKDKVNFKPGDAEQLPVEDNSCSAVISECSFCTFPDKTTAASEMFRVLNDGGRLGISDMTVDQARLPEEMKSLLFRAACIADARTAGEYRDIFSEAGFVDFAEVDCSAAILEMTGDIRKRLLTAELMVKLKKLDLGEVDFEQAKEWLTRAEELVREGVLGYVIITGRKV